MYSARKVHSAVAGLEVTMEPKAKDCGHPLETGKVKETFFFLPEASE